MPKIIIDKERCKGCQLCLTVCPRQLIKSSSQLNQRGYWVVEIEKMEDCISCQQCALICPEVCIQILNYE